MNEILLKAREEWLLANDKAVVEASSYLSKKGIFNPPLEKEWPKWAELRKVADSKWYVYYNLLKENFVLE